MKYLFTLLLFVSTTAQAYWYQQDYTLHIIKNGFKVGHVLPMHSSDTPWSLAHEYFDTHPIFHNADSLEFKIIFDADRSYSLYACVIEGTITIVVNQTSCHWFVTGKD